jgi:hypothetical protein
VEDFISFNPREINIGNVNDIVKTVLDWYILNFMTWK